MQQQIQAEMQGSRMGGPTVPLFDGIAQLRYEKLREKWKSVYDEFKHQTLAEDKQPSGRYLETEKLLDALAQINHDYITIAVPRFVSILKADPGKSGSSKTDTRNSKSPKR